MKYVVGAAVFAVVMVNLLFARNADIHRPWRGVSPQGKVRCNSSGVRALIIAGSDNRASRRTLVALWEEPLWGERSLAGSGYLVLSTTAHCSSSIERCAAPVNGDFDWVQRRERGWRAVDPSARKNSPTVVRLGTEGPPLIRFVGSEVVASLPLSCHPDQPTLVVAWVGITGTHPRTNGARFFAGGHRH